MAHNLAIVFVSLTVMCGAPSFAETLLVTCKNGTRQHMGVVDTNQSSYQNLFGQKVKLEVRGGFLIGNVKVDRGEDTQFLISLKSGAFSQNDGEIDPYIVCAFKDITDQEPGNPNKTFEKEIRDPHIYEWNPKLPPWHYTFSEGY